MTETLYIICKYTSIDTGFLTLLSSWTINIGPIAAVDSNVAMPPKVITQTIFILLLLLMSKINK